MKLLIDANLAPRVAAALRAAGHEAVHVGDIGLLSASDAEILEWADEHDHAVVTADSDFAMMLAVGGASGPSVVQLRGVADQPPPTHEALPFVLRRAGRRCDRLAQRVQRSNPRSPDRVIGEVARPRFRTESVKWVR